MSKARGIRDCDRSKCNSPSCDEGRYPDTPTSSKGLERLPHRINRREYRSKRNVDSKKVNRSPSSGYEKPGIERRYTKRGTTASPVVKVTSVELIKSWSSDCRLRHKDKEKLVRDSSSNRSSSSGALDPRTSPQRAKVHNLPPRTKSQHQKFKKSGADYCCCCDCIDYLRTERLKLLKDLQRHSKSRGTFPSPSSTHYSQGPPAQTQKLCSMLKTREAKRFIGCTCINDDWNPSCTIECKCPESPVDISGRTYSMASKKSTVRNDNARSPDKDRHDESSCSCSSPERSPSPKPNLQDHQPPVPPPNDRKKHDEHWKKINDNYRILSAHLKSIRREIEAVEKPAEIFRKKITGQYTAKEISSDVRAREYNLDRKNCWQSQRIDRSCQHPTRQNPPKAITAMQPKFPRSDHSEPPSSHQNDPRFSPSHLRKYGKNKDVPCRISRCECKPESKPRTKLAVGELEKIGGEHRKFDRKNLRRNRQKPGIRRHDFSLPRIVPVNKEGKGRDENRMMIYPPKDQVGCPLTLYKSGSFVNCSVEQVDDIGFKYDVSYVQRYVSRLWQPEEYSEHKINSDYLSTDDYG
ncbi:uncharacterized protein LOC135160847 [Diachasmimorpha longicaudata]|uniref:uncharacterized protein LOC135160847 n=1 Tax=Diachasmimorpha longicaudata TaxID=58733 RepID=UPI0030B8ACCE